LVEMSKSAVTKLWRSGCAEGEALRGSGLTDVMVGGDQGP
jgi:hypothetical protein